MRVALGVEYDGSQYSGWQRQQHVSSVQEKLEDALSKICNEKIVVTCAGRTDAGVHGTGQVVHFDTTAERAMVSFTLGVNANLPDAIAIRWAKEVSEDFHARYSATARRYRYIIYSSAYRPGILRAGLSHYHQPLDVEKMQQATPYLLGEQDFTSVRAVHCQSNTPFRKVMHLNVERYNDFIVIDIKANAFLHHMVRNIAGCLIDIGQGKYPPEWMKEVLALKDRTKASATAKPGGLYLVEVDYPEHFGIPKSNPGPLFLPSNL
jgi:tRNA pseudouridine38-40 synthase